MTTQPQQLGSLDFKEIKENLISYLKGQSIIKDYNLEGSVVQTLIDLMAYNTFYYAYYTNMVASEMFLDSAQRLDSIISLTKPLGYTVSGKRSSRAKIKLSGITSSTAPEHSIFYGINNDGIQFPFYTLDSESVSNSAATLTLVQGTLVNNTSAISNMDLVKQKFYILDEDVDISTIRVMVNNEVWQLRTNIGNNYNFDEKIYFIERINTNSFVIQFGISNSLGRSLVSTDALRIRYLRSSGNESNGISVFSESANPVYTCGVCSIELQETSSGGTNEPSVSLIKFLAPKYFASQNRAVTKNDYTGIILESGLVSDANEVSVFGGEEIYPPRFGRVFISIQNQASSSTIIDKLREKSVITIFPEYVQPEITNIITNYSFSLNDPFASSFTKIDIVNDVKAFVQESFIDPQLNRFQGELDGTILSDAITTKFPTVRISADDFFFSFTKTIEPSDTLTHINLGNEIDIRAIDNLTITNPFINKQGITVVLKLGVTLASDRSIFIALKQYGTNGLVVNGGYSGKVVITKGIIELPPLSNTSYILNIPFKKKYFKSIVNNITNFHQTGIVVQ